MTDELLSCLKNEKADCPSNAVSGADWRAGFNAGLLLASQIFRKEIEKVIVELCNKGDDELEVACGECRSCQALRGVQK